jgi:peptidoglycan/xylan/chitin deacetylase (PgdA/CDA1 family)
VSNSDRCRLEAAITAAQRLLDAAIKHNSPDLVRLRTELNAAHEALVAWDYHVVQVFSSPAGMVAVFEREDGLEEYIPVSYLGLTRSGRVFPYLFMGNCESKIPSDYPNFLRIDFASTMGGEVPFEFLGTEMAPGPEKEARRAWQPEL